MVALLRICSIVHIVIFLPVRWLTGKSHLLAEYNWSIRSMGGVIDILKSDLNKIVQDKEFILDEMFMVDIFKELRDKLQPFHEYWVFMFNKKRMSLVAN